MFGWRRLSRRLLWYGQPSRRRRLTPQLLQCWQARSNLRQWRAQTLLVVDLETSSLDPARGEVLSMGWVEVRAGSVRLATARHVLLTTAGEVGDSACIHQLRDCELVGGLDPELALVALLEAAAGKVLVFHHADMDLAYLDALCLRYAGAPLLLPYVDTLQLERQKLLRQQPVLVSGALTLAQCRQRYGLPAVEGHNALVDAMATAELLLAILAWQ